MLSSQRQEEEAGSQPFFKPSTQSQNAPHSFFMFGDRETSRSTGSATSIFQDSSSQSHQASTSKTSLLITPSLCPPATTVSSMPEFQYPQQQQQQQESTDLSESSSDRLSLLHTRLHKEADKIRSWKVQTEMDLKQRERKLQDAQFTIDSQKKSILELQLQNENLSRKLKEEMDNRSDISERIESTRDMCNLLKDYTTKLQDRIAMCESERDELKTVEKQSVESLEELGVMFTDLSLLHTNKVNDLKLALDSEKDSNVKNNEQLISQLREVQQKLKDLARQLAEKEENICQLALKKQEITQQLAEVKQENFSLQKTLTEALDNVQTQADQLEHADKEKLDLQSEREKLTNEKLELQQALQSHNKHIQELELNIKSLTECMQELTCDKTELSSEIQTLRESLATKLGEIDCLKEELKVVLEREQASYDKVDSIKQEKQTECEENVKLSELLKTAKDEKKSLEDQLLTKGEEIQELRTHFEALQKSADEENKKLEATLQSYKDLNEQIQILKETHKEQDLTKVHELQEEKIKTDNLNKDLEAINKQSVAIENKNKSLQGQLASKTKQLKDLQQELKTLKGKLTTQTKLTTTAGSRVSSVREELENKKTALEEIRTKLNSVTEEFEQERATFEELKVNEKQREAREKTEMVNNLEAEALILRQKTEQAVKEHGEAKQACELQMAEVSATLNKYKAENDRMVSQKDKEIEQLKKETEQQKHNKNLEEEQISQLKKDVQGLKRQLVEVQTERDETKQQVSSHEGNIQCLKKNLKEKEDELKLLGAAISLEEPMTGISPIAPKRNTLLPKHSTPKHQAKQVAPQTPKTAMTDKPLVLTPCKYNTPQHSILKQAVSIPRKRHVVFASDDDSIDGSISDSSSSQLMEIEQSEVERRLKNTPSQMKPSQAVQPLHLMSSRNGEQATPKVSSKTTPLRLSSGGKHPPRESRRSYLKQRKMRPQSEVPTEMTQAELSRFKELYPEEEPAIRSPSKAKMKKTSSASGNTRKTSNRIFKVKGLQDSFKNRKKAKPKAGTTKENDLSWLEMDSVYGFFE